MRSLAGASLDGLQSGRINTRRLLEKLCATVSEIKAGTYIVTYETNNILGQQLSRPAYVPKSITRVMRIFSFTFAFSPRRWSRLFVSFPSTPLYRHTYFRLHALVSSPMTFFRFFFDLRPFTRFRLFSISSLFLPPARLNHLNPFSFIFPPMSVTPKLCLIDSFLISNIFFLLLSLYDFHILLHG